MTKNMLKFENHRVKSNKNVLLKFMNNSLSWLFLQYEASIDPFDIAIGFL